MSSKKRELKEAYRTSRPPMGVLSLRRPPESFAGIAQRPRRRDVQVELGLPPQPASAGLWRRYGETSRWKCWKSSILPRVGRSADYKEAGAAARLCLERDESASLL